MVHHLLFSFIPSARLGSYRPHGYPRVSCLARMDEEATLVGAMAHMACHTQPHGTRPTAHVSASHPGIGKHLGPDEQGETALFRDQLPSVWATGGVWYWGRRRAPPPALLSLAEKRKLIPLCLAPLALGSGVSSPFRNQQNHQVEWW